MYMWLGAVPLVAFGDFMKIHPTQYQVGETVRFISNPDAVAVVVNDCADIPLRLPMVFVKFITPAYPAQLILQDKVRAA